tara:strand:- start:17202 stop:17900 length:699 start_codon:yes stop_codon:yes gene_type:complete
MNPMNEAWLLLKENVATTHTEYNDHMPEIKPHPAAVSYAQKPMRAMAPGQEGTLMNVGGAQKPNAPPMMGQGQGPLPGRKIQLMPRPKPPQGTSKTVNMQQLGLDPDMGKPGKRSGREMMDFEEIMDTAEDAGKHIYQHNARELERSKDRFRGLPRSVREANLGNRETGIGDNMGFHTGEGTLVPVVQPLGDLDQLDRLDPATKRSRMANRPKPDHMEKLNLKRELERKGKR